MGVGRMLLQHSSEGSKEGLARTHIKRALASISRSACYNVLYWYHRHKYFGRESTGSKKFGF
jgi:hypothetical protein